MYIISIEINFINCHFFSDIVHRDLKLENILLSHPVANELFNIKVWLGLVFSMDTIVIISNIQ